ncbi:MAG: Mur ligase domain-containing protein [Chloroflexota bacterium]
MTMLKLNGRPLHLFFSGIGGSGMSALAAFMHDRGHAVSGSDRAFDRNSNHPVGGILARKGISLVPQDGNGISPCLDLAVFSTAVEPDRPEVVRARELGVPTATRPSFLADLVNQFLTVAVAGTSGKSTTTGMLAFLMERLGLQPNFIGGGRVLQFESPSHLGNSLSGDSDLLVIEACESDGTIIDYIPDTSLVLNLDLDHHPVEETGGMFAHLAKRTTRLVITNADDHNLSMLGLRGHAAFSLQHTSDFRPDTFSLAGNGSDFSLRGVPFHLPLPGRHNLYNAIACIAVLSLMQVPLKEVSSALREFTGIERRFAVHLDDGKRLIVDDYAHNPHKISSLMQTVSTMRDRVCYVFQPHGYGPTRLMREDYIRAFIRHLREEDHLVLLPIFYEGGTAKKDISSEDLADEIGAAGKSVEAVHNRDSLLEKAAMWDAFVVFGARDDSLADLARMMAGAMRGR